MNTPSAKDHFLDGLGLASSRRDQVFESSGQELVA